jgi:hypothetical protein
VMLAFRVGAVVLISLMLVVGSFAVGNFGLSEGVGNNAAILSQDVDPFMSEVEWWLREHWGVRVSNDYSFAGEFLWVCVAIALVDSFRRERQPKRAQVEGTPSAPTLMRRKKLASAPPRKRHYSHRPL